MDDCSAGGPSPDIDYDEFNVSDCNCSNPKHWYVESCDCDYPEATAPPLDEVLAPGIIYAFVFVLGTLGNSMVIYVVTRYRKMRSVTNFFLASLSTADLLLLFFCVPIKYVKYLSYSWTMGGFFCWSHHYVQLFIMICSVLTLTVISVERYIAIAYPIRTVWLSTIGRAKRIVALIWLVSAVLAVPAAFTQKMIVIVTLRNLTAYWCMKEPGEEWEKAFALYQFILLFLVPVATMTFCYTVVGRTLQNMNHSQSSAASTEITNDSISHRKSSARSISLRLGSISTAITSSIVGHYHQHHPHHHGSGSSNAAMRRQSQMDGAAASGHPQPSAHHGSDEVANGGGGGGGGGGNQQRLLLRKSSRMPDQSVKQIVQMLILVVIIFVICWTPYLLDHLLIAFGYLCENSFNTNLRNMRMAFGIMAFANSSINPIVYAYMSKNFRTSFLAVCCRGCRHDTNEDAAGLAQLLYHQRRGTVNFYNQHRNDRGGEHHHQHGGTIRSGGTTPRTTPRASRRHPLQHDLSLETPKAE